MTIRGAGVLADTSLSLIWVTASNANRARWVATDQTTPRAIRAATGVRVIEPTIDRHANVLLVGWSDADSSVDDLHSGWCRGRGCHLLDGARTGYTTVAGLRCPGHHPDRRRRLRVRIRAQPV